MDFKKETCIFVGNFFEEHSLSKFLKYSSLSLGNDNYEKGFLRILSSLFEHVSCICYQPIPKFSHKFPFLFIKGRKEKIENIDITYIPFLNSRALNFRNNLINRKLRQAIKKRDVKMVFLSTYHALPQIKYLSKKFPKVKTALLLPDLPMVDVSRLSLYSKIYMSKINRLFKKNINSVNLLLPITPHEMDMLSDFPNKSFVYESFVDSNLFASLSCEKKNQILYAGSLAQSYGIMDLVEAFKKIESPDYKLIICGKGECASKLIEEAKGNKHIEYLGQLPHKDVLKLEKESKFIVCPDKEKREYSFHSKFLECLLSGTPVISFYPYGAKKEYIKYLYLVEEHGGTLEQALKNAIFKDYEKMALVAAEAEAFIKNEKNLGVFSSNIKKAILDTIDA